MVKTIEKEKLEEEVVTEEVFGVYELGYLLKPSMSEAEALEQAERLEKTFLDHQGEVIAVGQPKMLALSYVMEIPYSIPREKYDHAYFGWIKVELPTSAVSKIEEQLAGDTFLVRSLFIKTVWEDTLAKPKAYEGSTASAEALAETDVKTQTESPIERVDQLIKTEKTDETTTPASSVAEEREDKDQKKNQVKEEEIDKSIEDLIV